jgi:hypothetical protein
MEMDGPSLDDPSAIKDPYLAIYLTGGNIIRLQDVSIMQVSLALNKHGHAYLSDGRGSYVILFEHGVAAIQASDKPFSAT